MKNSLDVNSDFGGRYPRQSKFIDHDGVRQAYIDEGPHDSSVTFVCVHSNPNWSYFYRDFIRHFSRQYRVIAVDNVGFGRSDRSRDPAYYTIGRHIENLEGLLARADVKNAITVVHDWGGPIGLGWAARHPEEIAGVVVPNTSVFADEPIPKLPWLFRLLMGGWKNAIRFNLSLSFSSEGLARSER